MYFVVKLTADGEPAGPADCFTWPEDALSAADRIGGARVYRALFCTDGGGVWSVARIADRDQTERVARALCASDGKDWGAATAESRGAWMDQAAAALTEMRRR